MEKVGEGWRRLRRLTKLFGEVWKRWEKVEKGGRRFEKVGEG